jgi:hypothetical protein
LALIGELHEAIACAADVRSAIAATLPKPQTVGNDISYPEYGVSLKNPDPQRWKPDIEAAGNAYMLGFNDQTNVNTTFVGVMIFDPLLLMGPAALESLGPDAKEEDVRNMLHSMGRGAALNIGTNLEGERFIKFQGMLAYEGVVTAHMPNTKVKVIAVHGTRAVYLAMLFGAPENLPEYEKLITTSMQIQNAAAEEK